MLYEWDLSRLLDVDISNEKKKTKLFLNMCIIYVLKNQNTN